MNQRKGKPSRKGGRRDSKSSVSKGTKGRSSESKYDFASKKKTAGVPKKRRTSRGSTLPKFDDKIRLNKFLSNAGICSRREADVLIQTGVISVNGEIITEMGYKINKTDKVQYDGETIRQDDKHYVLVNKPMHFDIRYTENPAKQNRSVYSIIRTASKEFLAPVDRLNIMECGLIIYTNDSDMQKKLTHPKFKVSQLLHITLNKEITQEELDKMQKGMYVDNKMFSVEEVSFVEGSPKTEIGVKIFSNRNGIVKAMLKKLDYEIVKLDRVEYAGLTKIDLSRGHYRHLTKKEVLFLQMA